MNHTKNTAIEIKKYILSDVCRPDHSPSAAIENILHTLLPFCTAPDSPYTLCAAEFVHAYLQMGFSYLEHRDLFDTVFQKAAVSDKELDSLRRMNRPLLPNRSQIRSVIGRWPASPCNSHTITAAIDDIIARTESRIPGSWQYYTAKKDGSYTALYILTLYPDYALFHDVFKNKFYCLADR